MRKLVVVRLRHFVARSRSLSLCQYPAALSYDVFLVARRSRMWCLHDIGRDSWVWGEQEALSTMNSPPELGGRTPHREDALVRWKRGGPWMKWLLNLIII